MTMSNDYLTKSSIGFDRCPQREDAPPPDPAQEIGLGIGGVRAISAKFVIEGFWQDQSLLAPRKGRKRTAQPARGTVDFARENRRSRLIGGLPDEGGRILDPARPGHYSRPQEHQPFTADHCGA